ncbi:MAG: hypothetical protein ACM3L6_07845 [Deltaproteobacteria bacterium]
MLLRRFRRWPLKARRFCLEAARLADGAQTPLYLVGGCVRDLLLGAGSGDVDLVVEGDGVAFALRCARAFGGRCVTHRRFGTATLEADDGFRVDIASSRKETYDFPGALPRVERGTIRDDLLRRDFTVNALAMSLNRGSFGRLLDFCGGAADLRAKIIRVLHAGSFFDDPTRIVRAVRFEERLRFRRERRTRQWMQDAVAARALFDVQKHRLRDELLLLFREPDPYGCLRRLHRAAGLAFISPRLRWDAAWGRRFRDAAAAIRWFQECRAHRRPEPDVVYMALFLAGLPLREIERVVRAFALPGKAAQSILGLRRHAGRVRRVLARARVAPSAVHGLLAPLSPEAILGILAGQTDARVRRRIRDFLSCYSGQRSHVTGEDLKAFGLRPGPAYKRILEGVLRARLDGRVHTREEELVWARRLIQKS